ncbi:unnamed protein product [Owenia fusiformis]|uniref:Uncharacterized protein n=1 Tax=Owenia fusiformis TaxID=6347 RepID=A0A8J1TT68_OWEFU|nr:unnamed protein product [Owenia fusiformis]
MFAQRRKPKLTDDFSAIATAMLTKTASSRRIAIGNVGTMRKQHYRPLREECDVKRLTLENKALKTQIELLERNGTADKDRISELEYEVNELNASNLELQTNMSKADDIVDGTNSEMEKIQKIVRANKIKLNNMEEDNKEKTQRLEDKRIKLKNMKERYDSVVSENETLKAKVDELESDLKTKNKESKKHIKEIKRLTETIETLQDSDIRRLVDENLRLENDIHDKIEEMNNITRNRDKLQHNRFQMGKQIEKLTQDIEDFKSNIKREERRTQHTFDVIKTEIMNLYFVVDGEDVALTMAPNPEEAEEQGLVPYVSDVLFKLQQLREKVCERIFESDYSD